MRKLPGRSGYAFWGFRMRAPQRAFMEMSMRGLAKEFPLFLQSLLTIFFINLKDLFLCVFVFRLHGYLCSTYMPEEGIRSLWNPSSKSLYRFWESNPGLQCSSSRISPGQEGSMRESALSARCEGHQARTEEMGLGSDCLCSWSRFTGPIAFCVYVYDVRWCLHVYV